MDSTGICDILIRGERGKGRREGSDRRRGRGEGETKERSYDSVTLRSRVE